MERDAVVFRDVYGYDWNETKTLMGCSEPTARGHYKRGKEKAPRSK
jgi:DNA-directed RNA polymerase specialized sigma24 family protein